MYYDYQLASLYEQDRHRHEERRLAHHRALLQPREKQIPYPSLWVRLEAALRRAAQPGPTSMDRPCVTADCG